MASDDALTREELMELKAAGVEYPWTARRLLTLVREMEAARAAEATAVELLRVERESLAALRAENEQLQRQLDEFKVRLDAVQPERDSVWDVDELRRMVWAGIHRCDELRARAEKAEAELATVRGCWDSLAKSAVRTERHLCDLLRQAESILGGYIDEQSEGGLRARMQEALRNPVLSALTPTTPEPAEHERPGHDEGSAYTPETDPWPEGECGRCNGDGEVAHMVGGLVRACPDCHGTGRASDTEEP